MIEINSVEIENLIDENMLNIYYRNIENVYAYYRYRNMDISSSLIPKSNKDKSTYIYCSFKYICVEKDLNSINYPGKYWMNSKDNDEYYEMTKNMMNR